MFIAWKNAPKCSIYSAQFHSFWQLLSHTWTPSDFRCSCLKRTPVEQYWICHCKTRCCIVNYRQLLQQAVVDTIQQTVDKWRTCKYCEILDIALRNICLLLVEKMYSFLCMNSSDAAAWWSLHDCGNDVAADCVVNCAYHYVTGRINNHRFAHSCILREHH